MVAESDPWPHWLDAIHHTTRPQVIRREVVLRVGSPWTAAAAEETERTLRALGIFAMARVVAVGGVA